MSIGRRIYLLIGLILGPLAILGLRAYTTMTKTPRVRVVVFNESGKILLLKNVLAPNNRWTLPGGGVEKDEPYPLAAQRELREETGILVPLESLELVTTLSRAESGLPYEAPLFTTECASLNLPATPYNSREIASTKWFDPKDLPKDTAKFVHIALAKIKKT